MSQPRTTLTEIIRSTLSFLRIDSLLQYLNTFTPADLGDNNIPNYGSVKTYVDSKYDASAPYRISIPAGSAIPFIIDMSTYTDVNASVIPQVAIPVDTVTDTLVEDIKVQKVWTGSGKTVLSQLIVYGYPQDADATKTQYDLVLIVPKLIQKYVSDTTTQAFQGNPYAFTGVYIDKNSGLTISNAGFKVTDYLPITGIDDIFLSDTYITPGSTGAAPVYFYDVNKSPISPVITGSGHITNLRVSANDIPAGSKYFRTTVQVAINNVHIEGVSLASISETLNLAARISNKFFDAAGAISSNTVVNQAIISVVGYDLVTAADPTQSEYLTFYGIGKQFAFSPTQKRDYLAFRLGGPSLNYELDSVEWGTFYLENQTAPTGIQTYTFTRSSGVLVASVTIDWDKIPSGFRYVETTSAPANSKVLRYTYTKTLPFAIKRSNGIIPDVDLNQYYNTAVTASFANGGSSVPLGLADVSSFYAMWDALLTTATAAYCTKTLITDQVFSTSGLLSIYAYTFDPPLSAASDPTEPNPIYKPTILLILNTHGYEKTGAICIYELMNEVVTNWQSDPFLEYLRWNAKIVVIPSANPSGWNANSGQGSRKNDNGTDLNRNWPVGWFLNPDPTSSTYGGPSPLSEVESSSIKAYIDANLDNQFIGLDFHNFAAASDPDPKNYYTAWFEASTDFMCDCGYAMARCTTRNFRNKTTWLPADVDWLAARTNDTMKTGGQGKTAAYLDRQGYYAGTFEVCQGFRFNPSFQYHDADAIRFGVESQGNLLRLIIRNASIDYNEKF